MIFSTAVSFSFLWSQPCRPSLRLLQEPSNCSALLGPRQKGPLPWPSSGCALLHKEDTAELRETPLQVQAPTSRPLLECYCPRISCPKSPKPTSRACAGFFLASILPAVNVVTSMHSPGSKGWPEGSCLRGVWMRSLDVGVAVAELEHLR